MSEEQESQYQSIMGRIDETIKTNEIQKAEALNSFVTCSKKATELEGVVEDFEEKLKQLEEQNQILRDQAKAAVDKNKELKVMENEEFERLQAEKAQQEEAIREKSNELGILKDKLKQATLEVEELTAKQARSKEELLELAKQLAELNESHKQLEAKYKYLKEKYAEAREGVLKKYESRYKAKEKELEHQIETKFRNSEEKKTEEEREAEMQAEDKPEEPSTQPTMTDDERRSFEKSVEELKSQVEQYRQEAADLKSDCSNKDEEIKSLEAKLSEANKKKDLGKPLPAPAPPAEDRKFGCDCNINMKRLIKYMDAFDSSMRQLYKEFMRYFASKDDGLVDDLQLKMNKQLEQSDDMKEYILMKISNK